MRIAIMQPTYLSWSGYFGMMSSVDCFVLLDSVQFAKRSWQQRNQIKTHRGGSWLTVPVLTKGKREQLISEVRIDQSRNFQTSHLRSIELSYNDSTYFGEFFPTLENLLTEPTTRLVDLNIRLLEVFRGILEIETPLVLASQLGVSGKRDELLANICMEFGATEYLSAPGSSIYLDSSIAFSKANIRVQYFNYECAPYIQQHGGFIPYMSIIDLLLNEGPKSRAIIESGIVTA